MWVLHLFYNQYEDKLLCRGMALQPTPPHNVPSQCWLNVAWYGSGKRLYAHCLIFFWLARHPIGRRGEGDIISQCSHSFSVSPSPTSLLLPECLSYTTHLFSTALGCNVASQVKLALILTYVLYLCPFTPRGIFQPFIWSFNYYIYYLNSLTPI